MSGSQRTLKIMQKISQLLTKVFHRSVLSVHMLQSVPQTVLS